MTTPTLTLIVDGDPSDWMPTPPTWRTWVGVPVGPFEPPERQWVPVETLPEVRGRSSLNPGIDVGDTVTLAQGNDAGAGHVRVLPFATAEVAEVRPVITWAQAHSDDRPWPFITHTIDGQGLAVAWPDDRHETVLPGDWTLARFGIRVTNVEAL